MSWLSLAWGGCTALCLFLATVHTIVWLWQRREIAHLLIGIMAVAAAVNGVLELLLLQTSDPAATGWIMQGENIAIFCILVSMTWLVQLRHPPARKQLAIIITLLWCLGMVFNLTSPHSLTFNTVDRMVAQTTFWGEQYYVPVGSANPWVILVNIATLLLLFYFGDSAWKSWQQSDRQQAFLLSFSATIFLLLGVINCVLVDNGLVQIPYLVSFAFLFMVLTFSVELVTNTIQLPVFSRKLEQSQQELDQARNEMERVMRISLVGELVTELAHELNQPLSSILSNSQATRRYLEKNTPGLPEPRESVDDIIAETKFAADIIHRLRGMLKKDIGQKQQLCLNQLVDEVLWFIRPELEQQGIQLHLHLKHNLALVRVRSAEMKQVVLNLLLNSIRALQENSTDNPTITLTTANRKDAALLLVEDNGPGILAEVRKRIFEPFFTTSANGIGMGLPISRRIVSSYNGTIVVKDSTLGGARFIVSLPPATSLEK